MIYCTWKTLISVLTELKKKLMDTWILNPLASVKKSRACVLSYQTDRLNRIFQKNNFSPSFAELQ
jgi:hypothetical protein